MLQPISPPPRLALLVDGDNLSALHAARLMSEASRRGRIDCARVYADATRRVDWAAAPGWRVIHAGGGKNAADLLLCLDAMELALERSFQAVALASSDGDFAHLAQRLRERGVMVMGLGEAKTPDRFRAACSEFVLLPMPSSADAAAAAADPARGAKKRGSPPGMEIAATGDPAAATAAQLAAARPAAARPATARPATARPAAEKAAEPAPDPGAQPDSACATPLDRKIRALVKELPSPERGLPLAALGALMHQRHGVRISALPEKTWRTYLLARPKLYDLDPRGTEARLRLRSPA